jgi:hypothetical protein
MVKVYLWQGQKKHSFMEQNRQVQLGLFHKYTSSCQTKGQQLFLTLKQLFMDKDKGEWFSHAPAQFQEWFENELRMNSTKKHTDFAKPLQLLTVLF